MKSAAQRPRSPKFPTVAEAFGKAAAGAPGAPLIGMPGRRSVFGARHVEAGRLATLNVHIFLLGRPLLSYILPRREHPTLGAIHSTAICKDILQLQFTCSVPSLPFAQGMSCVCSDLRISFQYFTISLPTIGVLFCVWRFFSICQQYGVILLFYTLRPSA